MERVELVLDVVGSLGSGEERKLAMSEVIVQVKYGGGDKRWGRGWVVSCEACRGGFEVWVDSKELAGRVRLVHLVQLHGEGLANGRMKLMYVQSGGNGHRERLCRLGSVTWRYGRYDGELLGGDESAALGRYSESLYEEGEWVGEYTRIVGGREREVTEVSCLIHGCGWVDREYYWAQFWEKVDVHFVVWHGWGGRDGVPTGSSRR